MVESFRSVAPAVRLLAFVLTAFAALCTPSQAQLNGLSLDGFGLGGAGAPSIEAAGVIVPATQDQPPLLVVTATMNPGQWIYSLTQGPGGPVPTKIRTELSEGVQIGTFVSVEEPELASEKFVKVITTEKHVGKVNWVAPIALDDGVSLEDVKISGSVAAQICNKDNCFPVKRFPFTAKLGTSPVKLPAVQPISFNSSESTAGDPSASANGSSAGATDASSTPVTSDATDAGANPATVGAADNIADRFDVSKLTPQLSGGAGVSNSIPFIIFASLAAGFILNFMPCVLPVIGLKLLSFLEQGGNNPRRVLALNLWYSMGIISVFWILATVAIALQTGLGQALGFEQQSFGWGQQFQYDAFNIVLVSVVFVMALSFLGVWEIPIPGFASGRGANQLEQKEGAIGAFSKGMITTVLATPCSGPFLGTAVGFALSSTPVVTFGVFTLMGIGMALPYILVGFKPELMRFLPKPGAWMETFKQVMGFVLIGTVLWLFRPIDAPLVMPTLVLLATLGAACWWIGRTPVYASFSEKLKAWGQATAMVAVACWLAFSTPQFTDPLPWQEFTMAEFVDELDQDRTILVEFTADWCMTCKALKAANLDRTKTKELVERNNVAVYEVNIDHLTGVEREFFTRMQPSQGVPLVAVFPSGKRYEPICFGNGYTQSQILKALRNTP